MKPHKKYPEQCEQIVEVGKRLYARNMLAAADGNISVRVEDGVLITPSGRSKGFLDPREMALVSMNNEVLFGEPSTERLMHLAIYEHCSEAQAVVHAHPPTAIAYSVAFPQAKELPNRSLSEVILAAGTIPIVPYARPGTQQMGDVLRPHLPARKLMILSRHGALCWGQHLDEALMGMERLEHCAEILYRAQLLGGLTELESSEIEALWELRKKIGNRTL